MRIKVVPGHHAFVAKYAASEWPRDRNEVPVRIKKLFLLDIQQGRWSWFPLENVRMMAGVRPIAPRRLLMS
jgi:hypothetical protein